MSLGRQAPRGLLGMLVLVVLIESALSASRLSITTPAMEGWRFAAWAAERRALRAEVLVLGDSLVKFGVLPPVVAERTGQPTYNLATTGGTIPAMFFLLRRTLAAGARPRAVVADFAPLMLGDLGPPALHNYPELATLADAADLAYCHGDLGFLAGVALAQAFPSVRYRFELRGLIGAALGGRTGSRRAELLDDRHRWERWQGGHPRHPDTTRPANHAALIQGICPSAWTLPLRDAIYLDRFLALARDRGIAVYWLIPPLSPESQALRDRQGSDRQYDRLVRAKQAEFPGLTVLDGRQCRYDDSVYLDHMHLDRDGAQALSRALGEALAACPPQPNRVDSPWIALAPFPNRVAAAQRGTGR